MTSINKLPKGLILAHINICSLRNKIQDLSLFLQLNKIDILMISETHLDHFIDNSDVDIGGFSIYRNDRNRFGGGVAIYIRDHFPVKLRHDLRRAYTVRCLCDFSKEPTHTERVDRMRCKAKAQDLCAHTVRSERRAAT